MENRAYRVTVTDASRDVVQTFDAQGIEIGEDGTIYLPMLIGAKFVGPEGWSSVTITKIGAVASDPSLPQTE